MTCIQYASDLHLDHFPADTPFETFLKPSAPILILAGDIASARSIVYQNFLFWCAYNWKQVILITGNHEYYCTPSQTYTRQEIDTYIQQLCVFLPNVHFLQGGQTYCLPNTNIVFIGATLYSDIHPSIHDEILGKGDFTKTYVRDNDRLRLTDPKDLIRIHKRHLQAVSDAIRAVPTTHTAIVVTHYLPTEQLLEPEYQGERWRSCYASNVEYLIRSPVKVWICGHGHRSTYIHAKPNIFVAMNARGYNKRSELNRTVDVYQPTKRFII